LHDGGEVVVGELERMVPKDRDGEFQTELFERYQRSEKTLVAALVQMCVEGVSTRKVSAITEALCGLEVSESALTHKPYAELGSICIAKCSTLAEAVSSATCPRQSKVEVRASDYWGSSR